MPKETSAWLVYAERVFPDSEWREHLRAFRIDWSRTRSTDSARIWNAIQGKGYVIWVSVPSWSGEVWRVGVSVAASAPTMAMETIQQIIASSVAQFPAMRVERGLAL